MRNHDSWDTMDFVEGKSEDKDVINKNLHYLCHIGWIESQSL